MTMTSVARPTANITPRAKGSTTLSEIPFPSWGRVERSVHLGDLSQRPYLEAEVTIVVQFRALGKRGWCLGCLSVTDIGEWVKWFSYDIPTTENPMNWTAGSRAHVHGAKLGNGHKGILIVRHDTNPTTGLKSNVLRDIKASEVTVIG